MAFVDVNIPVIETDRLALRAPAMSDLDPMVAFMTSERSRYVRPKDVQMDRNLVWRALAHVAGQWMLRGYGSFIITEKGDDTAIGMTGPWHPATSPERELGWAIWATGLEGKGYAFEAASAARDFAFHTLGWDTAVSYIDPANARSIALAERLGCTPDENAKTPEGDPCLVYRHPTPEGDGGMEAYA